MYIGIFKIILSRRIGLKLGSFQELAGRIGISLRGSRTILFIYFLLKGLLALAVAIGLFAFAGKAHAQAVIGVIFAITVLCKVIEGGADYKNTFVFPFEEISSLSLARDKKIYRTQLLVSVVYSLMTDELLLSGVMFCLLCSVAGSNYVIPALNLILLSVLCFAIGNQFFGKYMYAVTMRRVTAIRLFVYALTGTMLVIVTSKATGGLVRFVGREVEGKLRDMSLLLEDAYVQGMFLGYGLRITTYVTSLFGKMQRLASILDGSFMTLICGIGIASVLLVKVSLIPLRKERRACYSDDYYYRYQRYLKQSYRKKHSLLVHNQMERFSAYRWLFAKNLLQVALFEYEAMFYAAMLCTLMMTMKDSVLRMQLLICMNLLVSATQASELRNTGYAYFSPANELDHLRLAKMSLLKKEALWEAKESMFRRMLWLPMGLLLVLNVVMCIGIGSVWHLIVAFGVWTLCVFIMPIIQLHMIPLVTDTERLSEVQVGETLMEEEVAGKLQEFPRIFLVVVPMLLSVLMLVLRQSRRLWVVGAEAVYLAVATYLLYRFMKRLREKGVNRLVKKVC